MTPPSSSLNPFGAPLLVERAALVVPTVDLDALSAFVAQPRRAVQLIGEAGRGKSTTLRALAARFPGCPVTYVRPEHAALDFPEATVVFVDEAQRIPLRTRLSLFRRPASFVLATHRSHRWELALSGVAVRTEVMRGLPLPRLREYVDRRMAWVGLGSDAVRLTDEALAELSRRYGTDMRGIERALYHLFEDARLGDAW